MGSRELEKQLIAILPICLESGIHPDLRRQKLNLAFEGRRCALTLFPDVDAGVGSREWEKRFFAIFFICLEPGTHRSGVLRSLNS